MTASPERARTATPAGAGAQPSTGAGQRLLLRVAVALACGLLGFMLVAQVRATEGFGDRLEVEREEDLAQILSELSTRSETLQAEITNLQLTLVEFESSAEREDLARRSLERRYDELRILTGTVPVEGPGVILAIEDPNRLVTQDLLVDTVQELRDAGAEAIAVNEVRLIASSAFATRNDRLVVDRQPIDPPYRIVAIGGSETLATALQIRGGARDSLELLTGVEAQVQPSADLRIPAVAEPPAYVFGTPVQSASEPP
ncbi:MAG: DUF881 domain-containing protein [Euzebyales bacterium]|nr:DUF881 domain-containing protein [Euzebyales bacterium]